MDSKLEVKSKVDKGSTFFFELKAPSKNVALGRAN